MNNLPTKSKLTTKGNIPAKLATVGVDASKLHNYTQSVDSGEIDVSELAAQIAEQVVSAICESASAETWEAVNGAGYVENWKAQIAADVAEVATGTAVQGRAFKQTVCDNVEGCTMDHFASDPKGAVKKDDAVNPFA